MGSQTAGSEFAACTLQTDALPCLFSSTTILSTHQEHFWTHLSNEAHQSALARWCSTKTFQLTRVGLSWLSYAYANDTFSHSGPISGCNKACPKINFAVLHTYVQQWDIIPGTCRTILAFQLLLRAFELHAIETQISVPTPQQTNTDHVLHRLLQHGTWDVRF